MADVFSEQLVKKEPTSGDRVNKGLIIAAAVAIAGILFLIYPPIIVALVPAEYFLVKYMFSFLNIEYEYTFTSGDLDIDVVYAKRRRKRKVSVDLKACEYVRRLREGERPPKAEVNHDFTKRGDKGGVWVISANVNHKRAVILFEPNDAMLDAIYKSIARKLQK